MMTHSFSRASLILAVPLMMGGLSVHADDAKNMQRTIAVSGLGRVSAPPKIADISVGIVSRAATAREALSTNNDRMAGLQQLLKERGIAPKDIQTSQFWVQPQYSQPPPYQVGQPTEQYVPRLIGYLVQNSVRVTVRDLSQLGLLLDALVSGGANQVYGINLRTDDDSLLYEARKRAMAEAKKKAEVLAGEAGMVVSLPVSIREETSPFPVAPPAAPPGLSYPIAAAAPSVPVAQGELETTLSVQVVYELKPPR
jgi:uncharacterized protein YggE